MILSRLIDLMSCVFHSGLMDVWFLPIMGMAALLICFKLIRRICNV